MLVQNWSYPEFVPNQVLTDTQLNQLRNQLDAQDRHGRVRLVGMGKICGLVWEVDGGNHQITVCEGFGVTSDGYLIELAKTTFTHFRKYFDPDVDDQKLPEYPPWQRPSDMKQLDIIELLDKAPEPGEPKADPLQANTGKNRVLVLYLEREAVDLKSCLVTDCNNKGFNINLNVRVLLVREQDLKSLDPCPEPPKLLRPPRYHAKLNELGKKLQDLKSGEEINKVYAEIIAAQLNPLANALRDALKNYGKFLDVDEGHAATIKKLVELFEEPLDQGKITQTHYDALKDLTCAYNEFITEACELLTDCCVEADFPRHLMLGAIDGSERYCHRFLPSPLRNVVHGDLERIEKLLRRIFAMIENYAFDLAKQIRITPSHTETYGLGERAMPFFYDPKPEMQALWQPELCCTTAPLWLYHQQDGDIPDLDLDYNRCSFLRIEGHLGQACIEAKQTIEQLRRRHNVEFDVLPVFMGDPSVPENQLIKSLGEIQMKIGLLRSRLRMLLAIIVFMPDTAKKTHVKEANGLIAKLQDLENEFQGGFTEWYRNRCGRRLHCDTASLESAYRLLRSEIICAFSHLRALLAEVPDPPGLEEIFERRVDSRTRVKPEPDEIFLGISARRLRAGISLLLETLLPRRLCGFSFELFVARYKATISELIAFSLVFSDVVARGDEPPRTSPLHPSIPTLDWGGVDDAYGFLRVLRDCVFLRLAGLALEYQRVRSEDLSLFQKFAAKVDGIEHLAGVEKCGTFVLVCAAEKQGEDEIVVADFSLSCRLPCCCEADAEVPCLPPIAVPDYRIVRLKPKPESESEFQKVDLKIDVLANDYDPNYERKSTEDPPPETHLKVELKGKETEQGGKVVMQGGSGVVRYIHDTPRPGVVDRFTYTLNLKSESCSGSATGHVLVYLAPAPEKRPELGNIRGVVFTGDLAVDDATVHLLETGASRTTDQKGRFIFENLQPGPYTLKAEFGDLVSEALAVTLAPGMTEVVVLRLVGAEAGTAVIVLQDSRTGKPIGHAEVVLTAPNLPPEKPDKLDEQLGRYIFLEIPPATYAAEVKASGFLTTTVRGLKVEPPTPLKRLIKLNAVRVILPGRFVNTISATLNVPAETARLRAEKLFGARHEARIEALDRSGVDPNVKSSEAFQISEKFLKEVPTNPNLRDVKLTELYAEVAKSLATAIAAAPPNRKKKFRDLLANVSVGFIDRLTLNNPMRLSNTAKQGLVLMKQTVRESGVKLSRLRADLDGRALNRELGVKSVEAIEEILR